MFDSHVHSSFSGDSEMDAREACSIAIDKGLSGLAFTDHLDIDFPDFDINFMIDFDKYSSSMDDLKSYHKNNLKVLKGIEVGIQPHVIEETTDVVNKHDFDFVISSIHIIDRKDPYSGAYFTNMKSKEQAFLRYLKEILFSLENFDNFDVIGHIGYVRRYCPYEDKSLAHKDFSDILDIILKLAISKGKGIEINTSGFRSLGTPIPDFDIIKRYHELGGEIITTGSDAHLTEHIAYSFDTIKKALADMGFKYTTYFEKRKPIFVPL